MSLEEKVFFVDKEIHSPSRNLAINSACVDAVRDGKYSLISRVYKHLPGVILGRQQSTSDVNIEYCEKLGYEIVKRESGGSAVVVSPESTLCYSVFLNSKRLGIEKGPHSLYKAIALPLASNLGEKVFVEGIYYLRYKINGSGVPFAGHAIKTYRGERKQEVNQFDGIVSLRAFDLSTISKLLKLRDLYHLNGERFIVIDGKRYHPNKEYSEEIDLSGAKHIKSEREELAKMVGLYEIGIREESFINALRNSLKQRFGELELVDKLPINYSVIGNLANYIKEKSKFEGGNLFGLGHCFVDFAEPEPLLIM